MQYHLNTRTQIVPQFKGNLPGCEWAYSFFKRQAHIITNCHCQNITWKCTAVSIDCVKSSTLTTCSRALKTYHQYHGKISIPSLIPQPTYVVGCLESVYYNFLSFIYVYKCFTDFKCNISSTAYFYPMAFFEKKKICILL